MSNEPCAVCGHVNGACTGNARMNEHQIITSEGVRTRTGPERVPMIRGRIGKAGYVGPVELYDPKAPNIRFVSGDEDIDGADVPAIPAIDVAPKRARKRKAE